MEKGGGFSRRELAVFVCLFSAGVALLTNAKSRPLLKFCFNSRDQFVAAQCVLCDFYQFSATIMGCNGKTSALMSNITSTEAVCIISNCLQQVRQSQPQFSGRRRREAAEEAVEEAILDARSEVASAQPSLPAFLARLRFLETGDMEEAVVDTIEVTVAEDEPDYE